MRERWAIFLLIPLSLGARAARSDTDLPLLERRYSEAAALAAQGTPEAIERSMALLREVMAASPPPDTSDLGARSRETLAALLDTPAERLDLLQQARALREARGEGAAAARTLIGTGHAQSDLGRHPEALATLRDAVERLHALSDAGGEAQALTLLGEVHYRIAEYEKAIESHEGAMRLYEAAGNARNAGASLNFLGKVYTRRGQSREALQAFERALPAFEGATDLEGVSWRIMLLSNIANAQADLGELERAEALLASAYELLRPLASPDRMAGFLPLRGKVRALLGRTGAALDDFVRARALYRQMEQPAQEAAMGSLVAEMHDHLGDWEQALASYRSVLSIMRERGETPRVAGVLYRIGGTLNNLGRFAEAASALEEALALTRATGATGMEADVLNRLGDAQAGLGQTDAAIQSMTQSLALSHSLGKQRGEPLLGLGRLHRRLGNEALAEEHLTRARDLWRSTGFRAGEAQALYELAVLQRGQRRLAEALRTLNESVDIVESLRGSVGGETLRADFLASKQGHYELLVDTRLRLHAQDPAAGHAAAAFEVGERARARGLLDTLHEYRVDIREGADPVLLAKEAELREALNARAQVREGVDPALRAEEEALSRRLRARRAHQARLRERSADSAQIETAGAEIATLLAEFRDVQRRIRAASPRYAALVQPQPARLGEIQRELLDGETALVEYFLGDERSVAWLVTPRALQAFELPGRDTIEAAARAVYEKLRARERSVEFETEGERRRRLAEADRALPAAARTLSDMVLGPLARELGEARRLVVVGDGALQYVPFAALPRPGGRGAPLLVSHEVVHAPSASVLLELRRDLEQRPAASRTIAVFADPVFGDDDPRARSNGSAAGGRTASAYPRLPDTRIEARNILRLVPRDQAFSALGFAANRRAVNSPEIEQYRIVHVATHAFVDSQRPELSGLVLSLVNERGEPEDGVLRLHDVYNLRLGADLVVLSACRTALGKQVRGEGMVGLTRGFMYAGARRVVASLWSSPDQGTAELMTRFYEDLLKKRLHPAAALRAAQLSLWRSARWRAPYYWAGFTVQGDWRASPDPR